MQKKKKKPTKKITKNTLESKWLGPKRLVQNDTLVKLDMGHLGYLLINFPNKKILFTCSAL
jgi:hypothetical protein